MTGGWKVSACVKTDVVRLGNARYSQRYSECSEQYCSVSSIRFHVILPQKSCDQARVHVSEECLRKVKSVQQNPAMQHFVRIWGAGGSAFRRPVGEETPSELSQCLARQTPCSNSPNACQ